MADSESKEKNVSKTLAWILGGLLALVLTGGGIAWAQTAPDYVVYFEAEDFSLSRDQKAQLDNLADELADATVVRIDGYVQRSREEDKQRGPARLSEKRAFAVEKHLQDLVKQRSPNKQDIDWAAVGRGQPPFDVGLPMARRVEIFID
jgi:outer membrane protein OmpA-like peptidoglycan-associated protein